MTTSWHAQPDFAQLPTQTDSPQDMKNKLHCGRKIRMTGWLLAIIVVLASPAIGLSNELTSRASVDLAETKRNFDAKFNEFKGMLKQLRQLQSRYQRVADDEVSRIESETAELTNRIKLRVSEMGELAISIYDAEPNQDEALLNFLATLVTDHMEHDRHVPAYRIGKVLVEHECGRADAYSAAALAAFVHNDYDLAELAYAKATAAGGVVGKAVELQGDLAEYRKLWEVERELREAEADANDLPRVKLETTRGEIVLELFENEAPDTVGNFISLVKKGFYDGKTFHRVIAGFMAQGGCPIGDGSGDAGYKIYCECYQDNYRRHFAGSLSMAKMAPRNTGGSQFFITFVPTPQLNGLHTVFGRVVEGMEVLSELTRRTPDTQPAKDPDRIQKATVLRDRGHEYKPNKVQ